MNLFIIDNGNSLNIQLPVLKFTETLFEKIVEIRPSQPKITFLFKYSN